MHTERPRVGVGVLVFNKHEQILLGKRLNSHGAATWSPPGGHLEFGESFASCALRELYEETGLTVQETHFIGVTNDIFWEDNKHYISIFMQVTCPHDQLPELCEPDKILEWKWFALDNVLYHGHIISVVWDKTGTKYHKGEGLIIYADGKVIARSTQLKHLLVKLPA